jgi:hypothetical protein
MVRIWGQTDDMLPTLPRPSHKDISGKSARCLRYAMCVCSPAMHFSPRPWTASATAATKNVRKYPGTVTKIRQERSTMTEDSSSWRNTRKVT